MNLLKEIGQLLKFRRLRESDKEIVFYAEHEGYYPNFEGVINVLTEEYNKTICYVTSDSDDPILKSDNAKIKPFYIRKLLTMFLGFLKCRVCVMTMTDLNQFHVKRSINPVHYVYIFHSLVSTHMLYLPGAFDFYDSILCTGPYMINEIHKYEKLHELPAKRLIEAGYYRLERIYNNYQKYIEENKDSSETNKHTVLIAPSWGTDNIIESCGLQLVEILLDNNFAVIVRPHPETVRRSQELLENLQSRFENNPDFKLELSVVTDDSLFKSDILISDLSGIVLEYAFGTGRPVLFIDVPPKIRNENYSELDIEPLELSIRSRVGELISPNELEKVPQEIEKLFADRHIYRDRIRNLREEYIFNFGNSSKQGAKYILEILEKD